MSHLAGREIEIKRAKIGWNRIKKCGESQTQLKCFECKQITNRIVGLENITSGKQYLFVNLKIDNAK